MVDPKREAELNQALELFLFAYRSFTAEPDRILAAQGLRRVHHRVLYFVARRPGISVGELLVLLAVSKQALHAPLRRLLELGLVESRPSPDDRRVRRLRLTEAGTRLERRLSGSQRERLDALFAGLGPEREAAWREVMTAVAGELPGSGSPAVG